jgi:hypothetical protein
LYQNILYSITIVNSSNFHVLIITVFPWGHTCNTSTDILTTLATSYCIPHITYGRIGPDTRTVCRREIPKQTAF